MAKNMARIENGLVVNIEWCSDKQAQTETLINLADRPVAIGDTYDGSDFYRDGEKVLTPIEKLELELNEYKSYYEAVNASIE